MTIEPFKLHEAQELVRDAVSRADQRHRRYRTLEALYRTGSLRQSRVNETGTITDFYPDLSEHVANLILPHVNIIQESVIARDPKLICEPIGGGEVAEMNAVTSEGVLSYQWRRSFATEQLRDATADAVRLGSGFVKIGWTHLEEDREIPEEERSAISARAIEDEVFSATEDGRFVTNDIELLKASVPHSERRVIRSEPFVEYVSPYDVFVPINTRKLEDTRWVVHRLTLPIDEILSNPEFDVTEESIVRDGTTINESEEWQAEWRRQTEDSRGIYGSTIALDTATIWEFYDMRTRRMMVFQLHSSEPLWEGEIPWSHRYPPFVHVRNYTSNGNDFWGFGDIDNVASLQDMFNEFLTEQLENARRSGQKYLVRANVVSDELVAALESSESDIVAPVNIPTGEPLDQVIVPIFRQALAGDVYGAKAELEDKMRQVLGINDFQAGGIGADRMSATAAAVVDGVATLRAQSKIASVERAASAIGNQILLLCQEYLDEPTAIRITSSDGARWDYISKEDIYGEFIVAVEGGSTRAINPATREQQGLRTLGEVVPALVQLGYDPEPALRAALRDLGYDPDSMLKPLQQEPMPMAGAGGPAEQSTPMTSEQMIALGGPGAPAAAQGAGQIAL
jgi:hypothetical protein